MSLNLQLHANCLNYAGRQFCDRIRPRWVAGAAANGVYLIEYGITQSRARADDGCRFNLFGHIIVLLRPLVDDLVSGEFTDQLSFEDGDVLTSA